MSKLRLVYRCSACATAYPQWAGRCPSCEAWNSMVEDVEGPDPDIATPHLGHVELHGHADRRGRHAGRWSAVDRHRRARSGARRRSRARVRHAARRRAGHRQEHVAAAVGSARGRRARCTSAARKVRSRFGSRAERLGAVGPNLWLLAGDIASPHRRCNRHRATTTRHHRQHPVCGRPRPRLGAGQRRAGSRLHPSTRRRGQDAAVFR